MEEIVRIWTFDHALQKTLRGLPQRMASTGVADLERRTQHGVHEVSRPCAAHSEHFAVLAIGEVGAAKMLDGRGLERLYRDE